LRSIAPTVNQLIENYLQTSTVMAVKNDVAQGIDFIECDRDRPLDGRL